MSLVATSSSISTHQLRRLIHGDNQPRSLLSDVLACGLSRLPCRTMAATMSMNNGKSTPNPFRSFNRSWQSNNRRTKNMFNWILWTLVPMFLPFLRNKGGPWSTLKDKVDTMVHTVEMAAEVIEEVAEEVEKVAEDMEEKLPEGALRTAAHNFHEVAEEAYTVAKVADDLAHKAEDIEKKMEDLVEKQESVVAAAKEVETDMADLQKATADAAKDQSRTSRS
ncbi:hypothetical protein MKW94_019168 [Papaver nudicaule]|uniref:Uncharacterized protein n=1 Tax=Papaver nudicaule TaxID=74823 RepID=A0AA42B277_PAPNU|nr:hypothetical protein [Papaver nudicaule]